MVGVPARSIGAGSGVERPAYAAALPLDGWYSPTANVPRVV